KIRMISGHMGREDKDSLSEAWGGPQCFDWYGVGDTGAIAGEGPDRDGLYVMEDAQYLEVCDIDTGAPVADGSEGDMVCTCLYKDDIYPIIRFNTHDVTRVRTDASDLGVQLKRIEGFLGRSDNMVKLRGINIFPQAVGPMLEELDVFAGEFICRCDRDAAGRDDMTVIAEVSAPETAYTTLAPDFKALLKQKIGIDVEVELAQKGALADLTQVEVRQKPIRLIDNRFKA
ncbi:MAG: phenylacetate--CoA ligase family protein, partial [Pseudomonadota bacterium]